MSLKGISLERHILESQQEYPEAKGDFSILLSQLALAAKIISAEVRQAGLLGILGHAGYQNVHGEEVQKLDALANETIINVMKKCGQLCIMVSEEMDSPIEIPEEYLGKYVLAFDPLDGSSNIDTNASIGTIFSIYRKVSESPKGNLVDVLQKGLKQVCAGYVIYGSSTIFVYTTGKGVNGFTLDPAVGEFFLSHENIRIPEEGKIYSVNEGNYKYWDKPIQDYVDYIKGTKGSKKPYSLRYSGTLISDFHRILLKGGIFMYPADNKSPRNAHGKLRLLYECSPLAFIVEQAGGKASDGKNPILSLQPTDLHQRTPFFIGSKKCVEELEMFIQGKAPVEA